MTEKAMTAIYEYEVPLPGFFIQEELDARGWAQRDLAFVLGIEETALNKIIVGKTRISVEMAKALAEAFDVDAELFANLQKSYDLAHASPADPAIARRAKLQNIYPVREMIKREWLKPDNLEIQLARFFEVANENNIPFAAAAKKTNAEEDATPIQLAWLYRVRQIAKATGSRKFSAKGLRDALPKLRALTSAPEEARNVPRILAECGVRFVIVEPLKSAKIDGVCCWLDDNSPVVGMSMRFDRIDNFWFVLRHEIEHVLQRHGIKDPVVDAELEGERAGDGAAIPEQERVANAAASDFCVPKGEMASFIARKDPFFSERDIVGFARRMNVHPGIVVGQIQAHTKRWDFLRPHLVRVRQFLLPGAMVDGWGQVAPVSL
jgi:HTH-type transcriptional regulator/antitoxin HigA